MIKQFVMQDNPVHFSYYRQGYFWYVVKSLEDKELYCFPVPLSDIADATLNHTDKAITFMRWIRQAIMDKTLKKEECKF